MQESSHRPKLSLALAGKGGTGKTTLAALIVRALRELGLRPILAVDADPNSNLATFLGVPEGRPLAEIRELGSSPEGSPASGVGRSRLVEDEIQRAISEGTGFDVITMGRPEGPRCYCYVNHLLRRSLDDLARSYQAVVIDNEAGMEHLSRRTTNDVDFLMAVANPTLPSLRAVERIAELARSLPIRIGQQVMVINRAGEANVHPQVEEKMKQLGLKCLAEIPNDPLIEEAGTSGQSVFEVTESCSAYRAIKSMISRLAEWTQSR